MFSVFYREKQCFQPKYDRGYVEPGLTQPYRSFATEADAEAAVAELMRDAEMIYDAWSERRKTHETEILDALCRPVVEYLRANCAPPIRVEVTDYGFYVSCGDDVPEYHMVP